MMYDDWKGKSYTFFQNVECEFFPCHKTANEAEFNCLFCYCPLYALGKECGGNFAYLENGIKSCDGCMFPHKRDNYGRMMEKLSLLVKKVQQEALAQKEQQS